MPNDLTTLSGALLEMKDELIYQLGQKGVTATYSSTDGLLGLIGKISDIQTGGGSCYKVTFDNASYTTIGSVTVSVTVLKNYSACVNETVTFTSSTSTTTTATTNSSGVATATITFSGSTTLTATIGGATDTATVTVQSYLFYDACDSASGLSNYGNTIGLRNSGTNTLEYNSTEQAYLLSCTKANSQSCRPINDLTGYTGSFKVTITAKSGSSPAPVGLVMYFDDDNWYSIKENFDRVWNGYKVNGTFNEGAEGIHSLQGHTLVTEFTVDNTNHTLNIKSYENNTLIRYTDFTINTASATSSVKYCLDNSWGNNDKVYLYEIKAEPI